MSALKKAVFLDRDGVLCEDTDYITSFEKLHIYPFAKKAIEAVVGKDVQIFDGGEGTAREMRRRMQCASLINPSKEKGTVKFINSKDTEEERELCEFLLNLKM